LYYFSEALSVRLPREEPMATKAPDREEITTEAVKLTVSLPKDAVEEVERIAKKSFKSKTQVLREAIALKSFIERQLEDPDTRLLIERGDTTREIVFT
jgi:predicted transcriptional regulator